MCIFLYMYKNIQFLYDFYTGVPPETTSINLHILKKNLTFFRGTFEHSTSSYYLEARPHFFSCDFRALGNQRSVLLFAFPKHELTFFIHVRALGNQPMLVQTRLRVKYLCLFVLLVHASNSVRNHTKLERLTNKTNYLIN